MEDDSDQNDDGLALDAVEEEAKEIRSREGKRVEGQFGMNDKLKRSMEVYMEKWMAGMTRRLDTIERSKQKEEEEKILSNTTQDLQDSTNKPVPKDKKNVNDETEDSSSDSSSDGDDNEALEASKYNARN